MKGPGVASGERWGWHGWALTGAWTQWQHFVFKSPEFWHQRDIHVLGDEKKRQDMGKWTSITLVFFYHHFHFSVVLFNTYTFGSVCTVPSLSWLSFLFPLSPPCHSLQRKTLNRHITHRCPSLPLTSPGFALCSQTNTQSCPHFHNFCGDMFFNPSLWMFGWWQFLVPHYIPSCPSGKCCQFLLEIMSEPEKMLTVFPEKC